MRSVQAPKRPRGDELNAEPDSGADAPRSAVRALATSDDTAFMEEVLRELSAQNEQARSNGGLHSPPRGGRSDPPSAPPTERPRTVQLARDEAFRATEGTGSVRAYLPARTVAPTPTAPIERATVKFEDPRRIPTMRVPRRRIRAIAASAPPAADEDVPTLRSGDGAGPPATEAPAITRRRPRVWWWLAGVTIVAVAAVIVATVAAHARW